MNTDFEGRGALRASGCAQRSPTGPMNTHAQELPPRRALVVAAFATVYVLWGSTYLGMRVAIETLPPFFMAGCRFLVAGGALLAVLRFRGQPLPDRSLSKDILISGVLLLVTANGLVVWAEQTVPSGITSLIVGLTPAWFAVLDWMRPGGPRPELRTVVGIAIGFAGIALLMSPNTPLHPNVHHYSGVVMLLIAGISWAGGSLFSKHRLGKESPWMIAALQMLYGGAVLMVLALCTGELQQVHWTRISQRSIGALLYLVVFGSWIGFSAYVWLLKVSKPAHVATYAYVNPVIALMLGNLLLREPLTSRVLLAGAIILTGVAIITMPKRLGRVSSLAACADARETTRTISGSRKSA
ncbi:MAG TPA: EamA family transporter [Verrucomicrobiae bacterium]|nr:EamA family transporter [Verrucomicrobiae bacterium]